ncbi:MAG: SDR family NAD(P)-dependent oxidoreductase [Phycisphaeraceae bacterium]|nr:MAG: SDR family NAD(P)-dependent oxidoreductase [Phycisphaeraceae bacterium]
MPRVDLTGKPIVITGASSGIGYSTALACADAGMPIVVVARRADRLDALVETIESRGGRAAAVTGDVSDPETSKHAVEVCIERFSGVYSVFANAGYGFEAPVHETGIERMRAIFETNFFGTLHLVEAAVPHMLKAKSGHVLICSSCIGKIALPYFGAYCATKAAQNHVGRAMNLELRPHGVMTSTVHPVGTKTDFFDTAKSLSETSGATLADHAPQWLMQTPETVAKSVVRCLERPKPEVWPSWAWLVRFGMAISMAFPRVGDLGLKRLVREYEEAEHGRRDQPAGKLDRTNSSARSA